MSLYVLLPLTFKLHLLDYILQIYNSVYKRPCTTFYKLAKSVLIWYDFYSLLEIVCSKGNSTLDVLVPFSNNLEY